jgi:hypothetical protein
VILKKGKSILFGVPNSATKSVYKLVKTTIPKKQKGKKGEKGKNGEKAYKGPISYKNRTG